MAGEHEIFFLVGHVRSGTNWVANLLNLHPQINCQGEFHFQLIHEGLERFTAIEYGQGHYEPVRSAVEKAMSELVRKGILALADRKPGAHWVGDRTPRSLEVFVPGTPHILVERDGRDVLVSWTYHELRHGGPRGEPYRTAMADDIAAYRQDPDHFRKHPERLFADRGWVSALARSWSDRMFNDRAMVDRIRADQVDATVHVVRYEDMVEDPERQAVAMYDFLGVDPHEADAPSQTTRTTAGFEREDPQSFFRKGKVGDWRNYATDEFRQCFKECAGEALVAAGYEDDHNW